MQFSEMEQQSGVKAFLVPIFFYRPKNASACPGEPCILLSMGFLQNFRHSWCHIMLKLNSPKFNPAAAFGIFLAALILCGCSLNSPKEETTLLASPASIQAGSVMISRSVPEVTSALQLAKQSSSALGFVPGNFAVAGDWITVDRNAGTITLMSGNKAKLTASGEGLKMLEPGIFSIVHKQRHPLWYATDSYFSERGLETPNPAARDRYRRGALGEFALFIDANTPIHSGLIWDSTIGGVRLEEEDLSRLYYQVDVGAVVEVR
jgi:hypothetical protein